MAGKTIVEMYHRAAPRAGLHELIYWHADLPEAQRWALEQEIKKLLARYAPTGFIRTEASQESTERTERKLNP